jgi:hypothetical protein
MEKAREAPFPKKPSAWTLFSVEKYSNLIFSLDELHKLLYGVPVLPDDPCHQISNGYL